MKALLKDAVLKLVSYFHNPELVGSLLLVYVIHMVSLTVNIPHTLLNGLKVIIAPTEEAVLRLRPDAKGPRPEALRLKEKEGKDPDAYDKMNALELVRMEISRGTLGTLVYFPAYEGMVLWALVSLGNFLVAQVSRCALPARRPMGWATLTLCGALVRAMWCNVRLVTLLGWDNDHSKFAVLSGFCGFFLAAGVSTMFPPGFFAFDLTAAASGFRWWCAQVAALTWTKGSDSTSPASALGGSGLSEEDFMALFVLGTAITAACVTASAALPSIRFAQFYQRALKRGSGASLFYRALLVVDLALPWVATFVWIRPFPSLVLGERRADAWGPSLRLGASGGAILARLLVAKSQLQAFLDGAKDAVLQELREKKVNPTAVRTKFDARLQYLVIAAAQYAAPALTLALALALFLQEGGDPSPSHRPAEGLIEGGGEGHIGGGDSAAGESDDTVRALATTAVAVGGGICDAARSLVGAGSRGDIIAAAAAAAANASGSSGEDVGSVSPMGEETRSVGLFVDAVTRIPGFPEAFWTGVAGFFAWWACVSWAVTYALGVAFWQAFPEDNSVEERKRRDMTTKAKREKVKGKAKAAKAKTRGASSN